MATSRRPRRATLLLLLMASVWTLAAQRARATGNVFFVNPCRSYDTRTASNPFVDATPRKLTVTGGACGVPADATAVLANLTVVAPTSGGYFVLYAGNQPKPVAAHLLFQPGETLANNAIVPLATDGSGTLNVELNPAPPAGTQAHFILDLVGYVGPAATAPNAAIKGPFGYEPVTRCRLADTRTAAVPLQPVEDRAFAVQGVCGIPAGAPAAAVNPVAVSPTAGGHFSLHAGGTGLPPTSTLNFGLTSFATANGALAALGPTAGADLRIYNGSSGTTHVVLDAQGYFSTAAAYRYRAVTPCRVLDTRTTNTPWQGGERRTVDATLGCASYASSQQKAAFAVVTVVSPTTGGFLAVARTTDPEPLPPGSAMNFAAGEPALANGMLVELDAAGRFDLKALLGATTATVHVVVDVQGYFQSVIDGAQFVSQSLPATMYAGLQYDVSVTMRNTGTTAWTELPAAAAYRLGAADHLNTWGLTRVFLGATESIAPGKDKTFTFKVTAPSTPGTYNFQWLMVHELVRWFGQASPLTAVNVLARAADGAEFVSQSVPTQMLAGNAYSASVTLRNVGTATWSEASLYRLGSWNPMDNFTWGRNRVMLAAGESIAPGASKTFTFLATAPLAAGTYNFQWRMVHDAVDWFGATSPNVAVGVTLPQESVLTRFYPEGMQSGGANYFFMRDHLGSVRQVVNASGAVVGSYEYDPFGRLTIVQGAPPRMAFTGHFYHAPTDLYLTHYRPYDADLGRWLEADSLGQVDGPNVYAYVGNDPVNFVDPDGAQRIIPRLGPGRLPCPPRGAGPKNTPPRWGPPKDQPWPRKPEPLRPEQAYPNGQHTETPPWMDNVKPPHPWWKAIIKGAAEILGGGGFGSGGNLPGVPLWVPRPPGVPMPPPPGAPWFPPTQPEDPGPQPAPGPEPDPCSPECIWNGGCPPCVA